MGLQDFGLRLESEPSRSFFCQKAANSLDIDTAKKLVHEFEIRADVETPYNVGLIVGASGSGKTTLAKTIWGDDCFAELLDLERPVIDQFPDECGYDDRVRMLTGVGLTSVVCWIRPAKTLSNGQRVRAEAALQMARPAEGVTVIDEWTSVVDRTVGKVMSHCLQKHARKTGRRLVLLSCHYDVIEWLMPDWIIDCNKQSYSNRRGLQRERTEKLQFDIREVGRETWPFFSKYHYLSDKLPGGHIETFGLFCGADQIGFQCFANYVPHRKSQRARGLRKQMHSNRTVIHPDYAGMGLGILLINETSEIMVQRGYDVRAKFSSTPIYNSMKRQPCWRLLSIDRKHKTVRGGTMERHTGFRHDVRVFSFKYVGKDHAAGTA